jgi:PAS domain S-box-containing protein
MGAPQEHGRGDRRHRVRVRARRAGDAVPPALQATVAAAAGLLDPAALAQLTVEHARDLLRLDGAALYWWDAGAAVLATLAAHDPRVPEPLPVLRPGQGVAGQAFLRREPVIATDYADWSHAATWWARQGVRAALAVPLLVGARARGALVGWSYRARPVPPADVQLLSVVGAQVTPALESMRLLAESEQRRAAAEALASLMQQGAATLDPATVCALVTETAGRLLGADYAAVALVAPEGDTTFHGLWGHRSQAWRSAILHLGRGAAGRALADGRTVVVTQLGENPDYPLDELPLARSEGARTVLHTPLQSQGRVAGALLLGWRSDVQLPEAQVRLAETLAGHAATLIASAAAHNALVASEERLQESAQRITTILESIAEAFVALDHARRFTYVNAAATRVLRRPATELLGRPLREVFPEGIGSPIHNALRQAAAEGVPRIFESEYPPLEVWFEIHAYPSPDGLSIYFQDISARKRAEAERSALLAEAQAARAAAEAATRVRDDFLIAAAHDLRTPLTAMVGYADLLQLQLDRGEPPDAGGLRAYLDALRAAGARLTDVVETMNDLAHVQMGQALSLKMGPVDLERLMRGTARLVVDLAGSSAAPVEVEVQSDGQSLRGDHARLERALQVVIGNAVKYSVGRTPVHVMAAQYGEQVVITVRDQGVGIRASELPHIVLPFYRSATARDLPGTSVGLAGAKAIVEQHGGTLTIASVEGRGTTVTITLPALAPADLEANQSVGQTHGPA